MSAAGGTTKRIPVVDYLVLGDDDASDVGPHLVSHACGACGALFFDRRNACARCGGTAFAPKPLAMSGANDWTIDIERKGLPELKQIYGLYGESDNVFAKCHP